MNKLSNTVSNFGEFELIDRIERLLSKDYPPDVLIGMGDDAAVIRHKDGQVQLMTCDMQIEDRHFRLDWIEPYQLGRRAMAVNISDIAAMGGQPTYALVSLGLPEKLPLKFFKNMITGMKDQMAEFNAFIVGGNLAGGSDKLIIDVFMAGKAALGEVITRSGANPGDRLFVSGLVGTGIGGYFTLKQFGNSYPEKYASLVDAYLQPKPRQVFGRLIAQYSFATAMIDISDGLSSDLLHICEQSGVGVELELKRLPLPDGLDNFANLIGSTKWELAVHGGDSYELLFTVKPGVMDTELDLLVSESNTPITEIGRILPLEEGNWIVHPDGKKKALEAKGWDHFVS